MARKLAQEGSSTDDGPCSDDSKAGHGSARLNRRQFVRVGVATAIVGVSSGAMVSASSTGSASDVDTFTTDFQEYSS